MKTKMTIKRILPVFMVTAMLAASITACGNKGNGGSTASGSKAATSSMTTSNKAAGEKFPGFKGKDFDGNDVDESLFSKMQVQQVMKKDLQKQRIYFQSRVQPIETLFFQMTMSMLERYSASLQLL